MLFYSYLKERADRMLSIKQLCEQANISQQTFYRLVRENKEFRELTEANRQKRGNGFKYDRAVLEWLLSYYGREAEETPSSQPTEAPKQAQEQPEAENQGTDIKALEAQIAALQEENNALKAQLIDKEKERQALFVQTNQLLFLLSQEKAEKQALLPAPRQPLGQRIKSFFIGKKQEEPGN